ncbi:PTS galactitol transporter subunit IIC [Calorimonas adulescens]|jgi:PTS system sugar-specific permease component.|uniref:PTS galactitol transporter subunit IIC n=1 Tax=Calorimonas adulescens TaxID=2606906 RepID=A0A5D8QE15_9THEO|nr:PTS transporter subunit IIC [Calorimonas adulescens]TZE81498.1 PTS galactitol transporter subunit IIC [Calorimonas adulescens]
MNLLGIVQYIVGLGANVFLPLIMFFLGLIFGLKPGKALRAGLTLGVAFTAINLFISQLLVGQIAPAAQAMINRTGLKLTAMDIGWPAASTISWAWPYAASMFPLQILLNLLLLWVGFTKTLNVDLWNVWQKVFAGAIIYGITGNLLWSYALAVAMIIIELKLGDLTAKKVQEVSGVPGISVPHPCATWLVMVTPAAYLLDKIPGLNKLKADPATIQKKLGFLGENLIIGLIMGLLIGALAGYSFDNILKLGVVTATVMVMLPRIVGIFMEALMPISEAASDFMKSRYPGREFYIGLDWPILAGHPTTITSAILLIPVLVVLSVILPGNTTLPFGDLGNFGCLMAPIVAITSGDLVRTLIIGVFVLAISLWGASAVAPSFTMLAKEVGVKMPENVSQITWLKTTPIIWAGVEIVKKNIVVVSVIVILGIISFYLLKKYYSGEVTESKSTNL